MHPFTSITLSSGLFMCLAMIVVGSFDDYEEGKDYTYADPLYEDATGVATTSDASRLLQRLQKLDSHFSRYLNLVLKSAINKNHQQQTTDGVFNGDQLIPRSSLQHSAEKRQSSSGAQICIWKVCPPSPWRRAGRPQVSGRR